jgi:hypothetical protein
MTGTLHENQYTFLIISRSVLIRMRHISDKICRENQNTHFVFMNFSFFENHTVWNNLGKNIWYSQRGHMRFAWRITTATNTHPEYVIFWTRTIVTRTRLIVALYVHGLSCSESHYTKSRCWRMHVLQAVIWFRLVVVWPVLSAPMCVTRGITTSMYVLIPYRKELIWKAVKL